MIAVNLFVAIGLLAFAAAATWSWYQLRHVRPANTRLMRAKIIRGTYCDADGPCDMCELELFTGSTL